MEVESASTAQSEVQYQRRVEHPKHWKVISATAAFPAKLAYATQAQYHDEALGIGVDWSSRGARKGRFAKVTTLVPERHRIARPRLRLWGWEPSNVSWWVAQAFTWGSVVWVVNGWFAWQPEVGGISANLLYYLLTISGILGGTLFEIGAVLMVVESLNAGRTMRFGFEVKKSVEAGLLYFHPHNDHRGHRTIFPSEASLEQLKLGGHGKANGGPSASKAENGDQSASEEGDLKATGYEFPEADKTAGAQKAEIAKWRWVGWEPRDIGFMASFITLLAATIYWESVIFNAPKMVAQPDQGNYWAWDAFYWAPQVVGSVGFILSGFLFMIETQPSWLGIQPFKLGWHVGFWNLIGGIGFLMCGIFGFWSFPAERYIKWGAAFSTWWGSWAFLIGSYAQLVEVVNKHPVDPSLIFSRSNPDKLQ